MASNGDVDAIALKARPVDADANNPQAIPKPGINIGNPIEALCANIPIASIPCTVCSNSLRNVLASSGGILISAPIEKDAAKIPTKINPIKILFFLNTF